MVLQVTDMLSRMNWRTVCKDHLRSFAHVFENPDVVEIGMMEGSALVISRLTEAFKNLDDRGWDFVSEGLADPHGAHFMLLHLLRTGGRQSPETIEDQEARKKRSEITEAGEHEVDES